MKRNGASTAKAPPKAYLDWLYGPDKIHYDSGRAEPEPGLKWHEVEDALMVDGELIADTLETLRQISLPSNWEYALDGYMAAWMQCYQGMELMARCAPQATRREKFKLIMAERRRVMNDILARAGARSRIAEPTFEERREFPGLGKIEEL
jgi:hypothetical protein